MPYYGLNIKIKGPLNRYQPVVCPHENSEPDNWAFLEKIFDAIELNGSGPEKVCPRLY